MAQLPPTKGNLLAVKRSRELAQSGFELMDKKRNILTRELMQRIDEAKDLQSRINTVFSQAYYALAMASISMGGGIDAATAVRADDSLSLRYRSVMGVEMPTVISNEADMPGELPYGLAETTSELDDAYIKFSRVKELIRRLAETENTVYRLAYTVKKAQKRSNALRNIVIPGLDADIARISSELEEKEREEFVRLKVIKARKS